MVDFSLWDIFRNLLMAARWTVLLSLVAFVGGGLVALALLLARLAKWRGAERGVSLYVQLFQGTPLLMQLFLAYFGLALFGINVPAWLAAGLALTLYTSADPCPMCQAAIAWAGIGTVVHGSSIPFLAAHGWWQIDIRAEELIRLGLKELAHG